MTVSEIFIAFFLSFGFSMLISLIAYKATDISYTPGDATKAAEELEKEMNEIKYIEADIRRLAGNAVIKSVEGLVVDWDNAIKTKPSPPTTVSCVTSASYKRCAYCDNLNDHETGVCDRCGAPLL